MTGNRSNTETTAAKMEWQEFYLLKANGTFNKSREKKGVVTQISGTYIVVYSTSNTSLKLSYSIENEIIGSCYSELKEELNF
jgi:hypothetical protein